jgi:hypothetical protein
MKILIFQYRPAIRVYKIGRVLQKSGFDVELCGTRELFDYFGDQFKYHLVAKHEELERLAAGYDILIHGNANLNWSNVSHPCRICAVGDVDTFRRQNSKSMEMERYTFREFDGFIFVSEEQMNSVNEYFWGGVGKTKSWNSSLPGIVIKNGILEEWLPKRKLLYSGNMIHSGSVKYRDLLPLFKEIAVMGYEVHLYPGHLHYPEEYYQYQTDGIVLHDRICPFELVGEFRQYDAGLILFNLGDKKGYQNLDYTLPNKLYEYRAAGLPVITYRFKSMVNYSQFDSGVLLINKLSDIPEVLDRYYEIVTYEQQAGQLVDYLLKVYGGVIERT